MEQNSIEFKQQRSLGDILSVTFRFLRENYKTFSRTLFKLVGPVFILLVAAVSYYSYSSMQDPFENSFTSGGFLISFGILAIALLLYFTVLYTVVFNYIKSYIQNNGIIDETEISQGLRKDFGRMLGLGGISWLLSLAGLFIFILPGIYVSIPLTIAGAVLIFRNEGISESITESFSLVKGNWWFSFLTILVTFLIVYAISMAFQVPLAIYMIIKTLTVAKQSSTGDVTGSFGWFYIVLTVIASLIQYILYAVIPVAVAFLYFHLNEKKNFTGTYETIENLGKDH
ncbi:MAG: hypothetical protein WBV11_04885 [Salegentibacter sp.]